MIYGRYLVKLVTYHTDDYVCNIQFKHHATVSK